MSEFASRVYVSTEAVVICLPVTLLFVATRISARIFHLVAATGREAATEMIAALCVLAMFVCVWRLMSAFVLHGRAGLRAVSAGWWMPPLTGAAAGVCIGVRWWMFASAPTWGVELVWTLPFVVPLLHLCIERRLRADAVAAGIVWNRTIDVGIHGAPQVELPPPDDPIDASVAQHASRGAGRGQGRHAPRSRDTGVPFA